MGKTATALQLPPLTDDLDEAKAHLDEFGIARVADALDTAELDALKARLVEQAARERDAGVAFIDGGGFNQRVWNLPSKGAAFRDLLRKPLVRTLARHILDGDYALSSHTANIAGPGGAPMALHSDQGYTPRSVDVALAMNVMWMLVDFTQDNGATRLVPGSHLVQAEPPHDREVATIAGVGAAGTALVFDGRIWHGTGANITADEYRYGVLTYFCRPWMRPQENYTLSTHPDVHTKLDDKLKMLLSFRVWRSLGGVQGPWGLGTPDASRTRPVRYVDRPTEYLGELP